MKKLSLMLALCIGFTMAQATFAKAAATGVYVTPKFIYGYTLQDSQKANVTNGSDRLSHNFGNDQDDAWGGALAVGYNFDKQFKIPVRAELEYAFFSEVEAKGSRAVNPGTFYNSERYNLKQESQIQTLMLNAYYDIKTGTEWTPYLGAGIGFAFIDGKTKGNVRSTDASDPGSFGSSSSGNMNTNLAWNVGLGIGWDATDFMTVDLGYRFVGLGESKGSSTSVEDDLGNSGTLRGRVNEMYMHQVMLGLRFTF